jgi:hypothetical protein
METNQIRVPQVKFDKDALAAKIAEKFSLTFPDPDADPATETVTESAAEPEATPEEQQAAEEVAEAVEEKAEEAEVTEQESSEKEKGEETPEVTERESSAEKTEKKPEAAVSNAPTLPAAYRRSLKAYEWTDEEIDKALKDGGPGFITTAQKIHATRSKEIAAFAEQGRALRQGQNQQPAQQTTVQPATQPAAIKKIDPAAVKQTYGDDKLVELVVDPVNQAIERLNRREQHAQQMEMETLERQIEGFFTGEELKPYADMYGAATKGLTQEQLTHRSKVLDMADALVGGYRASGRQLSNDDALRMAHDALSGDVKEKAIRQTLTNQLVTRQKGITLKPGARKPVVTPGATPRATLEKNVKAGLAKAFA